MTVLGPVDIESLGITMPHEHILVDSSKFFFAEPKEASKKKIANEPLRMNNLYWAHSHLMMSRDDMILADEELARKELMYFKRAGGSTIGEMSCIGLGRDPEGLKGIAIETGLNIIMGTGYYVEDSHPDYVKKSSPEDLCKIMVKEITVGADDTDIKAGIIGELGCSFPLRDEERKVLRASAMAQVESGVSINVHPSRDDDALLEIVKILKDSGADMERVVISHAEHFPFSDETLLKVLDEGCFLEFDTFGHPALPIEVFKEERKLLEMPSDAARIYRLRWYIERGFIDKLLVSQDCCFKHKYIEYGGYGYGYILRDVLRWMRQRGIKDKEIDKLIIENPKKIMEIKN
jgi:phosphotriesterase-related protein